MSMTRILFLVLGLLALGLFVRLWVGSGSYSDIQNLEQKIDQQNAANDEQAELKRKLQSDVVSLSKGDASVEEHARSELGMIRQGEPFYQVILKSDPTPTPGLTPPVKDGPHVE